MNSNPQFEIWESEYRNPKLVTKSSKPQAATMRFLKFLKKQDFDFSQARALDLGSGTGRNGNHLARHGAEVFGLEISATAVKEAETRAAAEALNAKYIRRSIGKKFPFPDNHFDIVLDITSSNSLSASERAVYLSETKRVLRPGGYIFVRALALEGDTNAKKLMQRFPGPEAGTYIMPGLGLREKVFARAEIEALYSEYFTILKLEKETGYTKFGGQSYKRNFWIMYATKRED